MLFKHFFFKLYKMIFGYVYKYLKKMLNVRLASKSFKHFPIKFCFIFM